MTLVSALLTLGLVIIVPLALELDGRHWRTGTLVAAVLAALSLGFDQGLATAAMAVPWLGLAAVLTARAAWRWVGSERTIREIPVPASLAYLTVGAAWLLLDRLGVEPVGV